MTAPKLRVPTSPTNILEGYLLNLKTSMDSENYSRGQQTVDFVERVRDYYYLLLAQNCSDS